MDSAERLPPWLGRRGGLRAAHEVKALLRSHRLATVCEGARCPNAGECFSRRTATFLILGRVCTRGCGFCAVEAGSPEPPDPEEPRSLAAAAAELGLSHVVVTSVTRDDLDDGGAGHFARVTEAVRERLPDASVELLVPDFGGSADAVRTVLGARPDVLNHNVETVPRLYPEVRPRADYRRSLELLRAASSAGLAAKSGLMVGLGENDEEVAEVMEGLFAAGCSLLTVGQYLRPGRRNLPVRRYVSPDRFDFFRALGYTIGFRHVAAGPLVRSSWRADESYAALLRSSGEGEGEGEGG